MAIAAVLKTAVRKDLQVRILYPPFLAAAVLVLGLGLAATPRAACACSTRAPAVRGITLAAARGLVDAQERFFADSGRFGSVEDLTAASLFLADPNVLVTVVSSDAGRFTATVTYANWDPEPRCTVTVYADGRPSQRDCVNLPDKSESERRAALIYFPLVLLGIGVRFATAGKRHRPIAMGTFIPIVFLLGLSSQGLGLLVPSWCDSEEGVNAFFLLAAGAYLFRNLFFPSYDPPAPPPPAADGPPRAPGTPRRYH